MDSGNGDSSNPGHEGDEIEEVWAVDTEPDANGCLTRGFHPLLNHLVLNTLSGFIRRQDLTASRLVCEIWCAQVMKEFGSRFTIVINGIEPNTGTHGIDHFLQLFESNQLGIPYTRFKLGPFDTTVGVGQQFLQMCGETAKEIDFNKGYSFNYEVENISRVVTSTPNLQSLGLPSNMISRSGEPVTLFPNEKPELNHLKKIVFHLDEDSQGFRSCPTMVEELLSVAPQICQIIVEEAYRDPNDNPMSVLNGIKVTGCEGQIEHLDLNGVSLPAFLLLLKLKMNGLKNLNITLLPGVDHEESSLVQLVSSFKNVVHLSFECTTSTIKMDMPLMPQLKSMTISAYRIHTESLPNLNQIFPKAEQLKFTIQDGGFPQLLAESEPCLSVQSVELHLDMSLELFHSVRQVFPNLTQLSLEVGENGDEIVREIFSQMTVLVKLSLHAWTLGGDTGIDLDSVFTGIPTRVLNDISHAIKGLSEMKVQERQDTILKLKEQHCTLPSISNMTNLKTLHLNTYGFDQTTIYLSDRVGYLALYSMQHIRHLDIECCKFSVKCCELIEGDNSLESWSFKNEYRQHIIPAFDFN